MSGASNSETKEFKASRHKLQEARKRGQVAQSKDTIIGTTTVAGILYLWLASDRIALESVAILSAAFDLAHDDFITTATAIGERMLWLAVGILAPLFTILIAVSLATSLIVTRGFVFAVESITPDFNKINPVEGFKRLFGGRAWITFLLSICKVTALFAALGWLAYLGVSALLMIPRCGIACAGPTFMDASLPLIVGICVILLVMGVIDLLVQRALFLDEMRMTRTELKDEVKNTEGDPRLRGQRRRLQRQLLEIPTGPTRATLVIADGVRGAVALRFVQGETQAPAVVAKGKGHSARKLLAIADRDGIPVYEDAELADNLARQIETGTYITEAFVAPVVEAMQRAQTVG